MVELSGTIVNLIQLVSMIAKVGRFPARATNPWGVQEGYCLYILYRQSLKRELRGALAPLSSSPPLLVRRGGLRG
jgi:hypothetical protein